MAGGSNSTDGNVTGNHGGSDYWVVKLKPTTVLVNGVTVDPTKVTVEKGDTVTLTATVSPYDATNQTINWMSDNTAVATVSDGTVTAVGAGTAVIIATTEDGGFTTTCSVTVSISIDIHIKPGSDSNRINLKGKGNIPVAVLGNAMFDVSKIDASSVVFAGAPVLEIGNGPEDVNGDGYMDIVFHFATQELHLADNDTEATLSGKTLGGNDFSGNDSVRVLN